MTSPIVLGNGQLHVTLNEFGQVDGFHFPQIGLLNHTAGQQVQHHIGVWVDGKTSWLQLHASDWEITAKYPYRALISATKAVNKKIGIALEFSDAVDGERAIFLRNIHIVNMWNDAREIRLFMHQAFTLDDRRTGADTIEYRKGQNALLHYRGNRTFMIGGRSEAHDSFDQYSVGHFGAPGQDGTYRDADDGELSMNKSATGMVDSTIRFTVDIPAQDSRHVQYWVAAGDSHIEAFTSHQAVQQQGVHSRIQRTLKWWHNWIHPVASVIDRVEEEFRPEFIKSLLYVRAHLDPAGAVMNVAAANGARYCRPYSAAVAIWPLIRLGYETEPRKFFMFCRDSLLPDGSLRPLLQADGAPGPHAHTTAGDPLHTNEAAMVLFMFSQFQQAQPNSDMLEVFYDALIKPLGRFVLSSIGRKSLPKPAHSLWGEPQTASAHTTSIVYAALQAGSELAETAGDPDNAVAWRLAAADMYTAAQKTFSNGKDQPLLQPNGTLDTADVFGAFMFGLFAADGPEITHSIRKITDAMRADGGVAPRYVNDAKNPAESAVATLWLAQYYVEQNKLSDARHLLRQAGKNLACEDASENASAMWAHAEYISTLLDMIAHPKED